MNRIAFITAGIAAGDRARARIARSGRAPGGHALWSNEDLQTLRRLHPDYQEAMRVLGRSYSAVRSKAQQLGLAPKREQWTGEQLLRLRKLYRSGAPAKAIQEAFPTKKLKTIYNMALYHGLRRARMPFAPTGHLVIDQIRARCFDLRLSMVDLDDIAKTGSYFAKGGWHSSGLPAQAVAVAKAVAALDGRLTAVWNDPEAEPPVARLRLAA